MFGAQSSAVTALLVDWRAGNDQAVQQLMPLAHDELRRPRLDARWPASGLSVEETADVLKISEETVTRDWRFAKAWLMRELSRSRAPAHD